MNSRATKWTALVTILVVELAAVAYSLFALTFYNDTYSFSDRDTKMHRWMFMLVAWGMLLALTIFVAWRRKTRA